MADGITGHSLFTTKITYPTHNDPSSCLRRYNNSIILFIKYYFIGFDFGWVKLVNAVHGSGLITKHEIHYMGNPCGFLWETEGIRFYFAGDTALTMDMRLLRDYSVDYAFLPIGGNFTMDVDDALKAAEMIRPRNVIPIHFNTFEVISASPEEFVKKIKDRGMEGIYMKPGDEIRI